MNSRDCFRFPLLPWDKLPDAPEPRVESVEINGQAFLLRRRDEFVYFAPDTAKRGAKPIGVIRAKTTEDEDLARLLEEALKKRDFGRLFVRKKKDGSLRPLHVFPDDTLWLKGVLCCHSARTSWDVPATLKEKSPLEWTEKEFADVLRGDQKLRHRLRDAAQRIKAKFI